MRGRLLWIAAWALAVGAPVLYLLEPGDLAWWLGALLLAPLIVLVVRRGERVRDEAHADGAAGAVSPPGDHGIPIG